MCEDTVRRERGDPDGPPAVWESGIWGTAMMHLVCYSVSSQVSRHVYRDPSARGYSKILDAHPDLPPLYECTDRAGNWVPCPAMTTERRVLRASVGLPPDHEDAHEDAHATVRPAPHHEDVRKDAAPPARSPQSQTLNTVEAEMIERLQREVEKLRGAWRGARPRRATSASAAHPTSRVRPLSLRGAEWRLEVCSTKCMRYLE